jgi:hypothetical protein
VAGRLPGDSELITRAVAQVLHWHHCERGVGLPQAVEKRSAVAVQDDPHPGLGLVSGAPSWFDDMWMTDASRCLAACHARR